MPFSAQLTSKLFCGLLMIVLWLIPLSSNSQKKQPMILTKPTHDGLEDLFFSSLNFSPDGKSFVCCGDGAAYQWQVATSKKLRTFDNQAFLYNGGVIDKDDGPYAARFSPDGKTLASVSDRVKIWNTRTWQVQKILKVSGKEVYYSPDSRMLAVAESSYRIDKIKIGDTLKADDTISVWSVVTGKKLKTLKCQEGIELPGFWRNGKSIIIQCEGEKNLCAWDYGTGLVHPLRNLFTAKMMRDALAVSEKGKLLTMVTYSDNEQGTKVEVYNFALQRIKVIANRKNVSCLAISANGKVLAVGGGGVDDDTEDSVSVYATATWRELYRIKWNDAVALALSPDGTWLGMGDSVKNINLWKLPKR